MTDDRTRAVERDVQTERKPRFIYLVRLFVFAFSSAKLIGCIYLGLFILLSLLRPLLAFLWGEYIKTAEAARLESVFLPAVLLLSAYFLITYFAALIERYVMPREEIERLDIVQANHQQELLHSRIFEKLASLLPETLEIPKINDRIEQVFAFVGNRYGLNTQVMLQSYIVIAKAVSVISIAASLYIFAPWLCVVVLAAPLPTLWSLTWGQKLRFKFVKQNTELVRKSKYFQDLMLSAAGKELKTLGLYDFFHKKWKDLADEYTVKEQRLIRTQTVLQIVNYFLLSLANVFGSVFAIVLMAAGSLSLGALGAVLSLISTLVNDTKELIAGFATAYMKKNEAAQFFDLMESPQQKEYGAHAGEVSEIEARGLKYRYPLTDKYVLNGVDFKIKKGEKVAFVGQNGMGKTTLVKLITGTLSPSAGELLINGAPAENLNPAGRYDAFSTVSQEPARYVTFTVADNVYIGSTAKPRDEAGIERATRFAGLSGLAGDTALGKDTGGSELSGGEWQKLAIARAAYRNRNFVVLDEPTSNLDPLAETEIFRKYIALAENNTVIFVTHRVSVASLADRVCVFEGGKIVEDGTHGELIRQGGEYARLYNEQAKWYNR